MTTATAPGTAYEGWAIVELMGHRRLGGRVSEAVQYGVAMLRLDVPKPCTGITAIWCPTHGDCKCPEATRHERMDDPACPLHRPGSDHEEGFVTQFYGGGSIYCVTPCGEQEARAAALRSNPEPVSRYEIRELAPPAAAAERDGFTRGPGDGDGDDDFERDERD